MHIVRLPTLNFFKKNVTRGRIHKKSIWWNPLDFGSDGDGVPHNCCLWSSMVYSGWGEEGEGKNSATWVFFF